MPKRAVSDPATSSRPPATRAEGTTKRSNEQSSRREADWASKAGTSQRVVISGVGAEPLMVPQGERFDREAMAWQRIVRNRLRWTKESEVRSAQANQAKALLSTLGIDVEALGRLADGGIVQVSVPYVREDDRWAARIFPWEYVLSSATRDRNARPLVIVRQLVRAGGADRPMADATTDPSLIVESAPGTIRSRFQFDSERALVRAALGERVDLLPDPTEDQLKATVREKVPAVIHLAGVDAHQGARVTGTPDRGWDGYMLADARGQPIPVEAQRLGGLLGVAARKPRLVSCNFENSAARVAAMAVAQGAGAAIGFQDAVDDALAELFFSRFYANWTASKSDTLRAFVRTLDELRSRPGVLTGLGIVLWSQDDVVSEKAAAHIGQSRSIWTVQSVAPPYAAGPDLLEAQLALAVQPAAPADGTAGAPEAAVAVAAVSAGPAGSGEPPAAPARPQRLVPGRVTSIREPPAVWAELTIRDHVNFVHLHNNGSLFETFRLRKSTDEDVTGVEVEVVLFVGRHSFPYKSTRVLRQPVTELRDEIRVPLTAELLRSVHETIQSVVYVRVRCEHLTVYEDTLPVRIASADEWMDIDTETRWLPSFVLPSDPAIDQVRQRSLPALRALDDTFGGGFLGYQALGSEANPRYRRVDVQANAIWSTLSFLYGLSYVNPPPTYTARAQRLRTPSEIARSQSGTCIDLALLYAACLEAIDIFPVILLYEGHANVGYWRSPAFHEAFQTLQVASAKPAGKERTRDWKPKKRGATDGVAPPETGALRPPVDPWELQRQSPGDDANLEEVLRRIDRQDLAVLETTMLTQQAGFGAAIQAGQNTFQERAFRSLVDIRIARRTSVTPLPIHSGD